MKAKHVGIIIWVVIAATFIFCFWYFGIKNIVSSDEPEDDESGINTFNYSCPHDDTYQEQMAWGIYCGILDYFAAKDGAGGLQLAEKRI